MTCWFHFFLTLWRHGSSRHVGRLLSFSRKRAEQGLLSSALPCSARSSGMNPQKKRWSAGCGALPCTDLLCRSSTLHSSAVRISALNSSALHPSSAKRSASQHSLAAGRLNSFALIQSASQHSLAGTALLNIAFLQSASEHRLGA